MIRPDLIEQVIRPTGARAVRRRDYDVYVNPTGKFVDRWPARRHRPHRSQDHRRHLRRHGSPRWRRVQRQGPVQGRPLRRLRGPLGRQARRRLRRSVALRGAGGLRHRHGPPGQHPGRDVRHQHRRPADASSGPSATSSTCVRRRSSATSTSSGRSSARPAAYGHFGRDLPEFTWEQRQPPRRLQGRSALTPASPAAGALGRARRARRHRARPPVRLPRPRRRATRCRSARLGCASPSPAAGSAVGSSAPGRRIPDRPARAAEADHQGHRLGPAGGGHRARRVGRPPWAGSAAATFTARRRPPAVRGRSPANRRPLARPVSDRSMRGGAAAACRRWRVAPPAGGRHLPVRPAACSRSGRPW